MEAWIEVNVVPVRERDPRLLGELVAPLVQRTFASELETWFFFWEPELRLRLRWKQPDEAASNEQTLRRQLDAAVSGGLMSGWYEAAHGRRGERYTGEAETYGAEIWPRVQKDWMNGSELALALLELQRTDGLSEPLEFHWSRHVHLFTNQLYGAWEDEIELCLRQALGYQRLLAAHGAPASAAATALVHELARELDAG